MKRDFADFWNLMWEVGLLACAAFALLNAYAPPQDLPWKPLDLNQPVGRATAAKVADFDLSPTAAPGAVRITGGAATPLAPADVVMQCPLAVRYVIWDRQVLQPAARDILGSAPARVENYGTYSCRRIYGSQDVSERPSEHARANALDVAGVTLADGRTVTVLDDWRGEGRAGPAGSRFLHALRDGACGLFATVLTPDYNAAHENHLHLDAADRGVCR